MTLSATAVSFLLVFLGAMVQESPSTPDVPEFDCRDVPSPTDAGGYSSADPSPLHAVYAAARKRGFKDGTARIALQFDGNGKVVSASVARSSGDRDLDRASMNWAFCTRIKPGKPTRATVPVMFRW